MNSRFVPLALAIAALPAPLAAENWQQVDELPGGIAVELDLESWFEALDGVRLVQQGVFRRPNASWTMHTIVSIDCELELAKISGVRLLDGDELATEQLNYQAEFLPINPGSAEAMYYRALCGKEPSANAGLPEPTPEDEGADAPPVTDSEAGDAAG
ncbi:MAG TPA: hypothetical protein VLA37_06295 [Sphingomonadaceae bacterium]|nr:hypothetical protein [Sphingomonadaceae bacterium]